MPEFKIRTPDGRVVTVSGPNRAGAMAFAMQNDKAPAPIVDPSEIVAPPTGNRSLAKSFKYGELNNRANMAEYLGGLNRTLEDGPIGQTMDFFNDKVANPVRSLFGYDPVDRADITEANTNMQNLRAANMRKESADLNYTPMTRHDIDGVGTGIRYGLEKVAESGDGMLLGLAAKPFMFLMGAGEVNNNLKDIEDLDEETRIKYASGAGVIVGALERIGLGVLVRGMPPALIGKLGTKGIVDLINKHLPGRIATRAVAGFLGEAGTETAQEITSIVTEDYAGKEFEGPSINNNFLGEKRDRITEAGVAGGFAGGTIRTTTGAATDLAGAANKVWAQNLDKNETSYNGAAADLARMLRMISEQEGLKLSDVKTQGGAKKTLEAAHEEISGQINELVKNDVVKNRINPKNAETLDELLNIYAAATTAIRQGKNKVKSTVSTKNETAILGLIGPETMEAQKLKNLFAQGNVLTDLFADGTKGGISQFTDFLNPFQNDGSGGFNVYRGLNVLGGVAGASQFGALPTAGIVVGGRAVDAVTGRRSKIKYFVKKMEKKQGQDAPSGPSIIEQAAQQRRFDAAQLISDAEAKAAQKEADNLRESLIAGETNNAGASMSPLGTLVYGTGLDAQDINVVAEELRQKYPPDSPEPVSVAVNEVLDVIDKSTQGQQLQIPALTQTIRLINDHLNSNSTQVTRIALPDDPLARQNAQRANKGPNPDALQQPVVPETPDIDTQSAPVPVQGGNVATSPENYQAGKQANIDLAANLQTQVNRDTSLSKENASALNAVLEIVRTESTPFADMQEMQQELLGHFEVPQDAVDKYFTPYLARAERQNRRRSILQQAQDAQDPNIVESRAAPLPPPPPQDLGVPTDGPALQQYVNPLELTQPQIDTTNLELMPSQSEVNSMKEGTYKPAKKRTLVQFAQMLNDRWQAATGRTAPFENTPENVDQIAKLMATEAANALQKDSTAIGWYDRKLKAAKAVVSLVDPRVTQSPEAEVAFDFALAVTSNGQAVADNFKYALEVFQGFMDTGLMPTDTWIKGGERNEGMVDAFSFFNAYNASGSNLPIQAFLDQDFMVNELTAYIASFNERNGTKVSVPSSEAATETVKGSYIIGPKIGQGFYQNIRGNYDPLTMDIWWMRMWNRLTGRPFEDEKDLPVNRAKIREELKVADDLGKRLVKETLKDMNIKRSDLKDDGTLDTFVSRLDKRYQSFYRKFQKENKKAKPPKPQLFKSTGTMVKNMVPQLQGQPKNAGERKYMRVVTAAAIAKLKENGIDISTADFQALMWYPEKQLFRQGGVAPGRGADNDYLDAAKILAEERGISNEQIEQALPAPDRSGAINNISGTSGQDGRFPTGPNRPSNPEESAGPILSAGLPNRSAEPAQRNPLSRQVTPPEIKQYTNTTKTALIGKKGSPQEQGIQTLDEAIAFAQGLGMTVRLYNSQQAVAQAMEESSSSTPNADTKAFFVRAGKKGAEGTVFAMRPSATQNDGTRVSDLESLVAVLHEISHGITLGPMDGQSLQRRDVKFTNPITGQPDVAPPGSFVHSALGPLLEGRGDPDIMAVIDNLQANVEVFTSNDPAQRIALRQLKDVSRYQQKWHQNLALEYNTGVLSADQARNKMAEANRDLDNYTNYVQEARELAVDPMIVYLLNPALAKKIMPKTAALIRDEFKKAQNPGVQFFAHPLAMVVAAVMAMVARGTAEEEDEKKQMQMAMTGALSNKPPPPGVLSAA